MLRHPLKLPGLSQRGAAGSTVKHQVVAFLCRMRDEVTRDLFELCICRLEGMLSREVPSTQARFADFVGDVEEMQPMGGPCMLEKLMSREVV